jgi:hypothetical protein
MEDAMQAGQHTDTKEELREGEVELEQRTGLRGPTGWWLLGLIVLGVLIAIVLVPQLMSGGTSVIPGTPVAAPANGASAV